MEISLNKKNIQQLRIARPTDQIEAITRFYCNGLGFDVIASFEDHDGFDGIMLSWSGEAFHLEFTHERGTSTSRAVSNENLLVFYIPDTAQWQGLVNRLISNGYQAVKSHNPYWDKLGITFEDPDGYRVVLQNTFWQT